MSKTCSPGIFPEGKVGDSGRVPGRRILNIMFSVPEAVPNKVQRGGEEESEIERQAAQNELWEQSPRAGGLCWRGRGRHNLHKNNRPAVRKPAGRESGRENEKNHVW